MTSAILRSAFFALALAAAAPAALALADEPEQHAEEEAEGHEEGGEERHHSGPLSLKSIVTDTHFMAAVLNFALLLLVLRKLGGQNIKAFLTTRRSTMEASINEAAEIKAKAEAKHQELTARLATLDAELAKLKTDLSRAAEEDTQRIKAEAEEAARRMRLETESLIEQHAQALSTSVRREVVEAAVLAAQQVIGSSVNPSDQEKLAEGFRQRIEALASHSGHAGHAGGPTGGQTPPPARPARAQLGGAS